MIDSGDPGWVELGLEELAPTDGMGIPFTLLAKRFESSADDTEAFIHDPRDVMSKEPLFTDHGFEFDWNIATFITNHHQTLSRIHLFVMCTVNPVDRTVSCVTVKQNY